MYSAWGGVDNGVCPSGLLTTVTKKHRRKWNSSHKVRRLYEQKNSPCRLGKLWGNQAVFQICSVIWVGSAMVPYVSLIKEGN